MAEIAANIGVSHEEFRDWCHIIGQNTQLQPRTWSWIQEYFTASVSTSEVGPVLQNSFGFQQFEFLSLVFAVSFEFSTPQQRERLRHFVRALGLDPDEFFGQAGYAADHW